VVIIKESYILAVEAKAPRHRLTMRVHAWILEASSLPAPARSKVSLRPPSTFICGIRTTATSLQEPATFTRNGRSKMNVSNGAQRGPAVQRNQSTKNSNCPPGTGHWRH
jgi:hypothetical protein